MEQMGVLNELDQLKALSVPLRLKIIKMLQKEPMTTTQVANVLNEKPNRLYYHVTELERVGILEVVETKQRGNLVEKYYQPVARLFRIDPGIFQQGPEGQQVYLETAISNCDHTILDIRDAVDRGLMPPEEMKKAMCVHMDFTLSEDESQQISDDFRELLEEWKQRSMNSGTDRRTHLSMMIYTKMNDSE